MVNNSVVTGFFLLEVMHKELHRLGGVVAEVHCTSSYDSPFRFQICFTARAIATNENGPEDLTLAPLAKV